MERNHGLERIVQMRNFHFNHIACACERCHVLAQFGALSPQMPLRGLAKIGNARGDSFQSEEQRTSQIACQFDHFDCRKEITCVLEQIEP
jgi:hypothetical protein